MIFSPTISMARVPINCLYTVDSSQFSFVLGKLLETGDACPGLASTGLTDWLCMCIDLVSNSWTKVQQFAYREDEQVH